MNVKRERWQIVIAGLMIGVIASLLVYFGTPSNMGFCIACFLRDTAGGLGLHRAAAVVLGSFIVALCRKEFSAKGGSAPVTRFVLGFFVMIGCLMFLGCPFRMILRLAGGDLNALLGLLGFALGILAGVFFLKRGYSLKRTYPQTKLDGFLFPAIQVDEDGADATRATALLRRYKLPFGVACRCTAENAERVATELYYDRVIATGAKFCWFFTCPAYGPEQPASLEQLEAIHRRVQEFRRSKPLLTLDFWDGPSPSAAAPQGGTA